MDKERESSALQSARKMLVVERKLVSNRGHHHTQVPALAALLPDHTPHLLAGASYDGFIGAAAGRFAADAPKLARLQARARYGGLKQKMAAWLKLATPTMRSSVSMGDTLHETSTRLGLDRHDLIIVPTAELDTLEAAVDLANRLRAETPALTLRFLSADFGEPDADIRRKRLEAARMAMTDRIKLYSETEELAPYLHSEFGLDVEGGFYLPCSIMPAESTLHRSDKEHKFRIGVFGPARREKGSGRIGDIALLTRDELAGRMFPRTEFVVQGSEADFAGTGIYGKLDAMPSGSGPVSVERHDDKLSPEAFVALFRSVDAVLLPYDVSVYGLQGSGVVQDAIAGHKLIIHSAGMAMASLLSHGNGRSAETERDFAQAIVSAAQRDAAETQAGLKEAFAYFQKRLRDHPLLAALS